MEHTVVKWFSKILQKYCSCNFCPVISCPNLNLVQIYFRDLMLYFDKFSDLVYFCFELCSVRNPY